MKIDFWKKTGKYFDIENEKYKIWLSGVFSYKDKIVNLLEIAELFVDNNLDFNDIIGWYRIVIYDKCNFCWYFWGDDAMSQHFFYYDNGFSDSLLEIEKTSKNMRPNYGAIAQILGGGYTLNKDTLIDGVFRTDKDCYYYFDGKIILEKSKKLKNFKDLKKKYDVVSILNPIMKQISNDVSAAICTGGTDSRSVISGLQYLGSKGIRYVITGHEDNPDIKVGQIICNRLNVPLTVIRPGERRENWLEDAFRFTDGEYDVVLGYRHLLRAEWEKANSINIEYGGCAGEFYKNNFYRPFRWFGKKKNADFYKKQLLNTYLSSQKWVGKNIRKAEQKNVVKLMDIAVKTDLEHTKLEKGNRIGYDILAFKSGAISNGYSRYVTKIDPLMARQICASASHDSWINHCMHKWQRIQIKQYCSELSDILTDQGYNCSMNLFLLTRDYVKKSVFYLKRVLKIGLGFKSMQAGFWDVDYAKARESETWRNAVAYCKKKDIIESNVEEEDIPMNVTGWIILIGMIFARRAKNDREI